MEPACFVSGMVEAGLPFEILQYLLKWSSSLLHVVCRYHHKVFFASRQFGNQLFSKDPKKIFTAPLQEVQCSSGSNRWDRVLFYLGQGQGCCCGCGEAGVPNRWKLIGTRYLFFWLAESAQWIFKSAPVMPSSCSGESTRLPPVWPGFWPH